jgi:hypothetical protein
LRKSWHPLAGTLRKPAHTRKNAAASANQDTTTTARTLYSLRKGGKPVEEVKNKGAAKARALLRLYFHSRKMRAASKELEQALADSREVSSWPGDRLPVGEEMSRHVEKLTRRLKVETEAHVRFAHLFKTAGWGHSLAAL